MPCALAPHLPFYGAVRRGSTNHEAVRRPRSGRESKSLIGPIVGDQSNILPLDLTLRHKLNLFALSFSHSITDQCIERASSSRSVAIRFNSYNAHLCFETDTQLGP